IIPVFEPIAALCLGSDAPELPLTSTNDITGTWDPAVINTAVAETITYTFTPDADQCAEPFTMDITIDELITPVFVQIDALCLDSDAPELPLTSTNDITGTWEPAVIN